jgi:hypothetical protein
MGQVTGVTAPPTLSAHTREPLWGISYTYLIQLNSKPIFVENKTQSNRRFLYILYC